MDLIYTNANRVDQGVLSAYSFDLSFGEKENDFEMTLGADEPVLEYGAYAYIEGTEHGGIVDAMEVTTNGKSIKYKGRTWHGMLNSKVIQPDFGKDYLVVSGDANEIIALLIDRLGFSGLFIAEETPSGISLSNYKFTRYCMAYDGIRKMLSEHGAKLKIVWKDRAIHLSAEPVMDYTEAPVDGDVATLRVVQHGKKTNHLICLGRGDLAEREVIHLYVNQFGKIVDTPYFTGIDDISAVYDYNNAESSEELRKEGIEQLEKLRDVDKAEISLPENDEFAYDIGDIVGATDVHTKITVAAAVTQKIVRIDNGSISTEYKTGG